jgi:hypothetical protein
LKIKDIIHRWTRREEVALRHQFYGKTMVERFRALRRSERNEAKLFLLAFAPAALIGPFIGKWSDASLLGKMILAATGIWTIGVIIGGGFFLCRAIYRASRK